MIKNLSFPILMIGLFLSFGLQAQDGTRNIESYFEQLVENGEYNSKDVAKWKVGSQHVSSISSINHIYFRQLHQGLEVHGTNSSIHILPNGETFRANNDFVKNMSNKMAGSITPSLTPIQAITKVAQSMNYMPTSNFKMLEMNAEDKTYLISDGGISLEDIPVQIIIAKKGMEYVVAYNLSVYELDAQNWWEMQVDANTGEVLSKNNWVVSCDWDSHDSDLDKHDHSGHSHSHASPNTEERADFFAPMVGGYNIYPMPVESPAHGPRVLVTDPDDPIASPFGWHDLDGVAGSETTNTVGNNVDAFENGDNFGFRPDGGAGLVFNFPINTTWSAGDQSESAIISNLFYWNNVCHDVWYQYGFDEASGNFQTNNYGNGGIATDHVTANAQIQPFCNATMGTPPDGTSGNMRMGVCGNRDGDLDNLVIVHEYTHGISIRLTGGAGTSGCLTNQEQMGEGWSDYYGLMMTIEPGDAGTDSRGVGTWLFNQPTTGPGIRPSPYDTDLADNPQTYDDIKTASVPHGVGSVWCTMLWEMTWEIMASNPYDADFYNGTGGNNVAMAIVTEAMKLQPCSPGFVDGRDAILAADLALYGGAHRCEIWTAFAKRGLGVNATQGSTFSRSDGTEDYTLPLGVCTVGAPLSITCPADANEPCGSPLATAATTALEFTSIGGTITGGSGSVTVTSTDTGSGGALCSGTDIMREYTITDDVTGEVLTCNQMIMIAPPGIPSVTCPADFVVACEEDIVLDPNDAIVTTDCGLGFAVYIKNPTAVGAPGCDGTIYTYIYKVVDDCGNVGQCEQQVMIQNTPASITVPAGGTVDCFEDIEISVDEATVTGGCAEYNLYLVPPVASGPEGCPGTTYTYTYRMVDVCGNSVEENVVFTLNNSSGPVITSVIPTQTTQCLAGANPNEDMITYDISCGGEGQVSITGPTQIGSLDCSGTIYRYTYTVMDECGRTSTPVFLDYVVQNEGPKFIECDEDAWLQFNCEDYGGEEGTIAAIQAYIASVEAYSACDNQLTVFNNFNSNNINTCINNGINSITFRATDNCGRTSFCTKTYVVVDTEAPTIFEQAEDHWEMCNFNSPANFDDWVDSHGGAEAYDGCSTENVFWSTIPANPSLACAGANGVTSVSVTFVVRDNCGNSTSTVATFNTFESGGFAGPDTDAEAQFNTEGLTLFQNRPNPFKNETQISFNMPEASTATLTVYNVNGQVLKEIKGDYSQGLNEVSFNRSDLGGAGVLYYTLRTLNETATKIMVIID